MYFSVMIMLRMRDPYTQLALCIIISSAMRLADGAQHPVPSVWSSVLVQRPRRGASQNT